MNDNFALNLGFNSTSFGNIAFSIGREIHSRGLNPSIFLIGGVQLDAQKQSPSFNQWLQDNVNKSLKVHSRNQNVFRLWHTNQDAMPSVSDEEVFLTFIETDTITEYERNILAQKKTIFVTSNYLKQVCEEVGLTNVKYLQLGFDSYNFQKKEKKYYNDGRIVFNLLGKWEHRKHTKKVIQAFLRKYANDPKVFLQCSVYNPFLRRQVSPTQVVDDNQALWNDALGGKRYFNISFLPWTPENQSFNDVLNSAQAVIGMGGGENFGAGEFHSVAMGKHGLILNSNGFKDWATPENSVLIQPNGKISSEDGVFFRKGNIFQQGNFFTFSDDDFISGLEQVIKRIESNPSNTIGLKLQERTYKETVNTILNDISV